MDKEVLSSEERQAQEAVALSEIIVLRDSYAMAPESLFFAGGGTSLSRMDVHLYLIRHPQGDVLFDLGTPSAETVKARYRFVLHEKRGLAELLASAGSSLERIKTVIVSHLHWDHFNENARLLPNASFYVQREEARDAAAPSDPDEYDRRHVTLVCGELYRRFSFVDGDRQLLPGIRLISLPGHTVGMQGAVVRTRVGDVVLASDVVFTYRNYEEGVPIGIYVDKGALLASMERIKNEGDIVLPQHDEQVFTRFPGGRIGGMNVSGSGRGH